MAKSITVALELNTRNFDQGVSRVDRGLNNIDRSAQQSKTSLAGVATGIAAIVGASAGLVSAVNAARSVEDLGITLKTLYGDAELAAAALDIVTEAAARLPVSLDAIQAGVPALALVEEQFGGLGNAIEFTSGIANAFGMSFQDAASNVQRALSAGIASADTFRDRGVKAFLGFEEGVKYTAEQTQELFVKSFEKVTAANADAVNTMTGQLSMFSDAIFQIQAELGEAFGESLKESLSAITQAFSQNKEEIMEIARVIGDSLGAAVVFVVENMQILVSLLAGAFASAAVGRIIVAVDAIVKFAQAIRLAATGAATLQAFMGPAGIASLAAGAVAAGAAYLALNEIFDSNEEKIRGVTDAAQELNNTDASESLTKQMEKISESATLAKDTIVLTEKEKQESMKLTKELMTESEDMLEKMHERAMERAGDILERTADKNTALEREIEIAQAVLNLSENERDLKTQLMELEHKRQDALEQIAALTVSDQERNELTAKLNELTQEQIDLVKERHDISMDAMAKEDAQAKKNEEAKVSLATATNETMKSLNSEAMSSMESAFVGFVTTGKGSFKDLIDDMLKQLKRLLAKKIFETIFGFLGGGLGSIFAGFFDKGGMIPSGKFGIVGEKGPEIVTGPANVIGRMETQGMLNGPGQSAQTSVVYNINATDAQSFKDMIAQDPGFIYNVTQAGARLQPI